jgi:hypothetical protein
MGLTKRSREMFRVELFCEDKNLPRVLRALTGLVTTTPKIQPVANAEFTDGQIKQRTNGNAIELFKDWVRKRKIDTVSPTEIRQFAVEHGYMEKSYSLILKNLVLAKVVRRDPKKKGMHSRYVVLPFDKAK